MHIIKTWDNSRVIHKANLETKEEVVRDGVNRGISFKMANLKDMDFSGMNLIGADFHKAFMYNACFSNCDLKRANLSHAELTLSDFRGADLTNAKLNDSNAKCIVLKGAKMKHTDLRRIIK